MSKSSSPLTVSKLQNNTSSDWMTLYEIIREFNFSSSKYILLLFFAVLGL